MQIYLVGGAVRDQLLNYPVYEHDWLVIGATIEDMLEQGYQQVGKDFPVFLHPKTKDEYALARTERKQGQGYTGFVCHTSPDVSIEEDLLRRDLTINAMAMDKQGALIDPYGGQQDLNDKCLRHVSPAFCEDPLRVLRLARFASRYHNLGFSIAAQTQTLMQSMVDAGELKHLVGERIWKETQRSLEQSHAEVYFQVLASLQTLEIIFPSFVASTEGTATLELPRLKQASLSDSTILLKQRFCLLLVDLFEQSKIDSIEQQLNFIETCNAQVKLPNEVSGFAQNYCIFSAFYQEIENIEAAKILQSLKSLGLLRTPLDYDLLLETFKLAQPQQQKSARDIMLKNLLNDISNINPQDFIAQGLQGKAIGLALEQRQLKLIKQHCLN